MAISKDAFNNESVTEIRTQISFIKYSNKQLTSRSSSLCSTIDSSTMPDTKHARNCKRRIVLWVHWNSLGKRQKMNGRKTWTNQIDERSGFLVVGAVGDSIGAPEYSPRLVTLVTAFASQQKRLLHFGERKWCALKCKHYYYFNCVISIMLLLFIISSSWRMLWDHALRTRPQRNKRPMESELVKGRHFFFFYSLSVPRSDVMGPHTYDSGSRSTILPRIACLHPHWILYNTKSKTVPDTFIQFTPSLSFFYWPFTSLFEFLLLYILLEH